MVQRFGFSLLSCFILSLLRTPLHAQTIFEQRYLRASTIVAATVLKAGFEGKSSASPVQKFFVDLRVEECFKGNLGKGDKIRVFVGGKTIYEGKVRQVCDTEFPDKTKGLFFLGYLFPDERDFTSGAAYFLDVYKPLSEGQVEIRYPRYRTVALSDLRGVFANLEAKNDPKRMLNECDLLVVGKIKKTRTGRNRKRKVVVSVDIEATKLIKGDLQEPAIQMRFTDLFRRIHYRNRKRSDIPFYISNDRAAIKRENQRNFFLTVGEQRLFCLDTVEGTYHVHGDYLGIFHWDDKEQISSRTLLTKPCKLKKYITYKAKPVVAKPTPIAKKPVKPVPIAKVGPTDAKREKDTVLIGGIDTAVAARDSVRVTETIRGDSTAVAAPMLEGTTKATAPGDSAPDSAAVVSTKAVKAAVDTTKRAGTEASNTSLSKQTMPPTKPKEPAQPSPQKPVKKVDPKRKDEQSDWLLF